MTKLYGYECTECEIEFNAKRKPDGSLPDCLVCLIDDRVFKITKEDE